MNLNRTREDRAFRKELVSLLPRLRRFALSLSANMEEADDLVQAACERALARRHQWRPGSRLDSWMFKIIYHIMLDRKKSMCRKRPHLPLDEERLASRTIHGMKKLEAKWKLESVMAAMNRLQDRERVIISLVCLEEMTYREAAETLRIPVGTVMSRLARARKKLHSLVTEPQLEDSTTP